MLIALRDVAKLYRMGDVEIRALDGVSIEIAQGEYTAIMGPSGSGKSTLMNLIGCLDQPTRGDYLLEGMNVARLSENKLAEIRNRRIGFVFQNYNLLARTQAVENVEMPLIYSGARQRRKRAVEALELVGLGDRLHHRPNELSGGQQQRVAIARALVNEPSLILADEPTGNLDSKTGAEIMALFEDLNRGRGITILFVTHEREIARRTRRVIHLRDGRVVQDERPAQELHPPIEGPQP